MQTTIAARKRKTRSVVSWLVTLVLVAALVSTITAIGVPNLLRSRIAANESSAVGSVRTINTAIATYSAQHPDAGYPQRLSDLTPYIDGSLASGQKSGYHFRYVPVGRNANGVITAYHVEARPVAVGESGQRLFSSDETGAISYQNGAAQPKQLLGGGTPTQQEGRPDLQSRRMVRKSSVNLIVADPAPTVEKIRAVAYRLGGYVESVRFSGQGQGAQEASVTIRVPVARLDDARREVRALGDRVNSEEDDAQDVTGHYVDLESNLRNYQAEEAQYLEIMRRSGTIKDTLAVAERLADVRGRIERTQGQLNLLAHQTEMAVLEVTLGTEVVAQPVDVRWHPKAEIQTAFWDAASDLSLYANFMIAVVFRLPVFVLWVVTALVFAVASWRLLRWLWSKLVPAPLAAG